MGVCIIGLYPDGLPVSRYGFSVKTKLTVAMSQVVVGICIIRIIPDGLFVYLYGIFVVLFFLIGDTQHEQFNRIL